LKEIIWKLKQKEMFSPEKHLEGGVLPSGGSIFPSGILLTWK